MTTVSLPVTPGRATVYEDPPPHRPAEERFKHIEIEILSACDLSCFGCDRFSDVTTAPNMTVGQVRNFVKESLDLRWEWERIRLLGGEPTLHPQLREICGLLIEYRRAYPKCFLQLLSNGRGKLAQHRDWLTDRGIDPHVEAKSPDHNPPWFVNTRLVPADSGAGEVPPCSIFGLRGCGIGLTRHGYFLDGAGASAARVAGHDVGVMTLGEVTWERMLGQAKVLCRVCGHWNPATGPLVTRKVTETGEVYGPYWTETLARFKVSPPKLRVYAEA